MARPKKTGLDYFPFDVDFFEDEKIVAISGEFGMKGELAVIKLLCAIYRNGYFIEWSEMLQMKMLHSLKGVSLELLKTIVLRLVRWGFFEKTIFDSTSILTSVGIQKRYFDAISRRNKEDDYPYLLIDLPTKKSLCIQKPPLSEDLRQPKPPKVKKSKVNNTINGVFTHTHTHAQGGEAIKQTLLTSEIWCDQVRKTYHLTLDEVSDCVNAVVDYLVITSPNPSKSDAMRLFPKQVEIYRATPKGSIEERKARLEKEMREANANSYYSREDLREFYQYWTQTDSTGNKMLYESHQYWDTAKRMELWKQRKQA